jgi:hypothetical protein
MVMFLGEKECEGSQGGAENFCLFFEIFVRRRSKGVNLKEVPV